ncbi:hypothetical protein AOLI_G00027880 [Acnodon oligacanthus]
MLVVGEKKLERNLNCTPAQSPHPVWWSMCATVTLRKRRNQRIAPNQKSSRPDARTCLSRIDLSSSLSSGIETQKICRLPPFPFLGTLPTLQHLARHASRGQRGFLVHPTLSMYTM